MNLKLLVIGFVIWGLTVSLVYQTVQVVELKSTVFKRDVEIIALRDYAQMLARRPQQRCLRTPGLQAFNF